MAIIKKTPEEIGKLAASGEVLARCHRLLRRIDGTAPPDEVTEEVRRTLATMRLEQDEAV